MASCFDIQFSISGSAPAAGRSVNGVTVLQPLPWQVSEATFSGGQFVCPSGTHILLTPAEINSLANPWFGMTAADGVSLGWSVAAVWLSVYAIAHLAKIAKNWTK